jgi:hypothetical protein
MGRGLRQMLGTIDKLTLAHRRPLRLAVVPVAAAATVFSIIGKGLGWRIGGIAILAVVALWTYLLYFIADQRYERIRIRDTTCEPLELSIVQLHQHVCKTTDYWDYLRSLLAEVASTSIPEIRVEPVELPGKVTELGESFTGSEKMMRELLDHIIPPKSRYVVYYVLDEKLQASSEVHNGWKGRPPDLQQDSLRHKLLLTTVQAGKWVVLPDVVHPAPEDVKFTPLCFDKALFQSFASLPLRVEESVSGAGQEYGLGVGVLIVESPNINGISERFCLTAVQVAADILALAFVSARSNFHPESIDAKR